MSYSKDKVRDVMAVLTLIRREFDQRRNYRNMTELRKDAVERMAEMELKGGRYKNRDSAIKTIHDACARRLKPDVANIMEFDRLVDKWLRENSMYLEQILLKHSNSLSQRAEVRQFFGVGPNTGRTENGYVIGRDRFKQVEGLQHKAMGVEGEDWNWQSGTGPFVNIGKVNPNGQRCCVSNAMVYPHLKGESAKVIPQ